MGSPSKNAARSTPLSDDVTAQSQITSNVPQESSSAAGSVAAVMDVDSSPEKNKDTAKFQDNNKFNDTDDNSEDVAADAAVSKKRGRPSLPKSAAKAKKNRFIDGHADDGEDSDEDKTVAFDAVGETKITSDGELLDGRKFKCRYFRLARHPTRYYMLTLDVARSMGFRDSYLLHMKNTHIKRLYASDEDKQVLESMDLLASNFRTRPLGIMSTRSAFKLFGYQIVVRGKPVRDDYACEGKAEPENWIYPEDAVDDENGNGNGNLSGSDAEDRGLGDDRYRKGGSTIKRPTESISYYEQLYRAPANLIHGYGTALVPPAAVVATIGGATIATTTATPLAIPSIVDGPVTVASAAASKLEITVAAANIRDANGNSTNNGNNNNGSLEDPRSEANMLRAAASAADFNSRLRAQRRSNRFLDIHTNIEQVPQLTQPTRVVVKAQDDGLVLEVGFGDAELPPEKTLVENSSSSEEEDKKYPLSIMPSQYQGAYSFHRTRFGQNVASIKSNEAFFVDYTGKALLSVDTQFLQAGMPQQAQIPGTGQRHSMAMGTPTPNTFALQHQQQQRNPNIAGALANTPGAVRGIAANAVPVGTPVSGSHPGTSRAGDEHYNAPGFVPQGMTAEQWKIMKPKLTYSQLKELREQAPVVSMGPSGKYSVRFTCGYLTRSGNYCQKPVLEAGVICLFHQKMRAQEALAAQEQQQAAAIHAANFAAMNMNMGGMPMMPMMPILPMTPQISSGGSGSVIAGGANGMVMPMMMDMNSATPGAVAMPFQMQNMMPAAMMMGAAVTPVKTTRPYKPRGTGATALAAAAAAAAAGNGSTGDGATAGRAGGGGGGGGSGSGRKSNKAKNLEDLECVICHSEDPPAVESDQNPPRALLRCDQCGQGHHLLCAEISTPVMVAKTLAPGAKWKCGNCKMCEVCGKAGDDEGLMVLCDACDKGYHTYCLDPPLDKTPSGSWHCPSCRVCISCGSPDNSLDARHVSVPPTHEDNAITGKIEIYVCTYCSKCHKRFEAEQFCPLCFHVYKEDADANDSSSQMACCDVCDRWIHVGCDPELTESRYKKLDAMNAKYTCVLCSEGNKIHNLVTKVDKSNKAAKPSRLMMYHGKYLVVPPLMKRAHENVDK
ncbi:hypothetical protein HK100_012916 [Physocladia obscura]|uniref:Uncharacterized protein n=1 Tax=Physocladia obscura TaxID=109957 RepID=A0AAD5T0T3_9FUNG|nr:hypothetical protein HK100_012916 [Physocladia obscura]